MTNNHQRVDKTTPQTAQPSGLAVILVGDIGDNFEPFNDIAF